MVLIFLYLFGALALSFLCSILEAVLLSTPMSFITMKETQGNKTALLLKKYKTNIDKPVAAILSLNTIAHTIGAAGVGSESVKIFGEEYFGVISAVLTLLILVLSEIIPKTIGGYYWRILAIPSTRIIHFLVVLTYPLVVLSEFITRVFMPKKKQISISREEVSAMVNVGLEEGVFRAKESRIIQSFIKLNGVKAKDIMTPKLVVETVAVEITFSEFYEDERLKPYSRIPVYRQSQDYIIGYVLKDTILDGISADTFDEKLENIVRPIISFQEDESVYNIWERLLESREHISVIVDEYGCMRGIVTMEDVIETMLGVEIIDENDTSIDMQELAHEVGEKLAKFKK